MKLGLSQLIFLSFSVLIILSVINTNVIVLNLNRSSKVEAEITEVIDPSLKAIDEFNLLMNRSKMLSNIWVFYSDREIDKTALKNLQTKEYPAVRATLKDLTEHWEDKAMADSMNIILNEFEKMIQLEREVMRLLHAGVSYENREEKMRAEEIVSMQILPYSDVLIKNLESIRHYENDEKSLYNLELNQNQLRLRYSIFGLTILLIIFGIGFAFYISRIITRPITHIRNIINGLSRGDLRDFTFRQRYDEIDEILASLNNLKSSLKRTTEYAVNMGKGNMNVAYSPISEIDILGNALLAVKEHLRSSEQHLKETEELTHSGSWELDVISRKITFSEETFRLIGLPPAPAVPTFEELTMLVHPADREFFMKETARAVKEKSQVRFDYRLLLHNAIVKYIQIICQPVLDEEGKTVKLRGIIFDFTERKKMTLQVQEQQEFIRKIIDTNPNPIYLKDKTGRFIIANAAIADLYNTTTERLIGKTDADFLGNPEEVEAYHAEDNYVIETGNPIHISRGKFADRLTGESRWFQTIKVPFLSSDDSKQVLCIATDITARKAVEEKLKKLTEDLEEKVFLRTSELSVTNDVLKTEIRERYRIGVELQQKNLDLTDSINYARKIQEAILPSKDEIDNHFAETFILYLPKDIVSGDFYWFYHRGDKSFLALLDCTGHGVPGAFMSLIANEQLNHIIKEKGEENPDRILSLMDQSIKKRLKTGA